MGREGMSPLQKCIAAIRMIAYGTPTDELENLKIATSTTLECLGKFSQGVIDVFGEQYLRPPNQEEVEQLLQFGESCGFPGMLGSIDCMYLTMEKLSSSVERWIHPWRQRGANHDPRGSSIA
jgi:hypothetical protein